MQTLCLVLAVWLGVLAGLSALHPRPTVPAPPDYAHTTVTEQP